MFSNEARIRFCFLSRFSRASVQTVLPPYKKFRAPRLCSSFDDQIKELERRKAMAQEKAQGCRGRKRVAEEQLHHLKGTCEKAKVSFSGTLGLNVCIFCRCSLYLNVRIIADLTVTWL